MRERIARERIGLRRWRPGPGSASYSPFLPPPTEPNPQWLDHEVEIINRALLEHGVMTREALAQRVGAHYWGPGRFRAALRAAIGDGTVRRLGRNTYAPASGSAPRTPAGSTAA